MLAKATLNVGPFVHLAQYLRIEHRGYPRDLEVYNVRPIQYMDEDAPEAQSTEKKSGEIMVMNKKGRRGKRKLRSEEEEEEKEEGKESTIGLKETSSGGSPSRDLQLTEDALEDTSHQSRLRRQL